MPKYSIMDYCKHICKAQIETIKHDKEKGWYWDLPAMAAICHSKDDNCQAKSYSHNPNRPKPTVWNTTLKIAMNQLGHIGRRSTITGCQFPIGNCAEQHAANNYMKKYKTHNLNALWFSEALRPRTKEIIPTCSNCKSIFPNL